MIFFLDPYSSSTVKLQPPPGPTQKPERLQWKNPGMSTPPQRDQYLTVDQSRAIANIFQYLVLTETLASVKQALDVGCGSGNSTFQLCLKGRPDCIFVGVDTDENIGFASQKYLNPNLSFQQASSPYQLPESPKPGGWDLMTAFAFFSWIPLEEQPYVLHHMHSLLAEGGQILVRTQAVQDRPYRRATDEITRQPKWAPFFTNYVSAYQDQTAEGFHGCLHQAGFVDIQTQFSQDHFSFPTKEAMAQYFLQWLPELSAIVGDTEMETEELRKDFTTDVIDRYCLIQGSSGKNISLDFPCITASAKKSCPRIDIRSLKV